MIRNCLRIFKPIRSQIYCNFSFTARYYSMAPSGVVENFSFRTGPAEIISAGKNLIVECRKTYDSVAAIDDQNVNFESVLQVLDNVERDLFLKKGFCELASSAAVDKAVRDAALEAAKMYSEFDVERSMRKDIFKKLKCLEQKKGSLTPTGKRYLEELIKQGNRNGLNLPDATQEKIKELQKKISVLELNFQSNLDAESTVLEFTKEELKGLPDNFLENLKKNEETGKLKLSLKYPDVLPVLQKCQVPNTRFLMLKAFDSRCIKENVPLLKEMSQLRHKHAQLLGYRSHVAYCVDNNMAKTQETVEEFITGLKTKMLPLFDAERKTLLEFKQKDCEKLNIPFDGTLNLWDLAYYNNIVKEVKYSLDSFKLKEYFPLQHVIDQVFAIYKELLGLKFEEIENTDVWHEEVKSFSVSDSKSGELLGYFYLDLFPREGKFSHAALFSVQPSCRLPDGSRQVALGVLVANFPKPQKDQPSLLPHSDVTTFFHEFGHVMHFLCAKSDFIDLSMPCVESDFIEAPSQMLENWCWEKDMLRRLGRHHGDGSPIPDDMLDSLVKSRLANKAYGTLKQLIHTLFDYTLHTDPTRDPEEIEEQLTREILQLEVIKGTHSGAAFMHMVQLSGRYYAYLWSEVYSMDMFYTCFKDGNLRDPEVGARYRKMILEPGHEKDAIEMLTEFLGRPPNQDAFLKSKGL